jgi:hypothetical protein
MPKIVLISRRVGGMSLTEYLNEQNGHSVVRTPAGFWSQRKRVEFGGPPFPHFGPSQIDKLAAALVEAHLSGGEPPMVPAGMSSGDVLAALRIVETLYDGRGR